MIYSKHTYTFYKHANWPMHHTSSEPVVFDRPRIRRNTLWVPTKIWWPFIACHPKQGSTIVFRVLASYNNTNALSLTLAVLCAYKIVFNFSRFLPYDVEITNVGTWVKFETMSHDKLGLYSIKIEERCKVLEPEQRCHGFHCVFPAFPFGCRSLFVIRPASHKLFFSPWRS